MKHFDLFSGYGGFTLALQRYANNTANTKCKRDSEGVSPDGNISGTEHRTRGTESSETIGFSEIDKYASAVLAYHYPLIKNYGDITKIDWSQVPDFDLLTGGSPCQDLSIAGKRAGLDGARSGLFFEFMRAVREKKPKYFIWENVKGALSSNRGFDFAVVLSEMAEAGYSLWWQVLNAKDFGVPQNRERIFVVGTRTESPREVFFEAGAGGKSAEISYALDANYAKGTNRADKGRRQLIFNEDIMIRDGRDNRSCLRSGRVPELGHTGYSIRRLTEVECERLMSLPDNWTSKGIMNGKEVDISGSQRYKMCGNGVVVNVVEKLYEHLLAPN